MSSDAYRSFLNAVGCIQEEAIGWLQQAEGELADFNRDLPDPEYPISDIHPEVSEAFSKFPAAYAAIQAILEPLAPLIKSAEEYEAEQEKWNPN